MGGDHTGGSCRGVSWSLGHSDPVQGPESWLQRHPLQFRSLCGALTLDSPHRPSANSPGWAHIENMVSEETVLQRIHVRGTSMATLPPPPGAQSHPL